MRCKARAVILAIALTLGACGTGEPAPGGSPFPEASLRGGVRGELGEAQKDERGRRQQEDKMLEDEGGTPAP